MASAAHPLRCWIRHPLPGGTRKRIFRLAGGIDGCQP